MAHKITNLEALKNSDLILDDLFLESIVPACCSDGCMVEPDGMCEHGFESVLTSYLF
jgi:hypothetical protein